MVIDYKKNIAIDPDNLDEECLLHPMIQHEYGELLAEAGKKARRAAEKVKVTRSELTKNFVKENNKAKVGEIEAHYRTHKDHQLDKNAWIDAEYEKDIMEAAYNAIQWGRKAALEYYIKLYVANYVAPIKEPKEITPGKRIGDDTRDAVAQKQREDLNRRRPRRRG